MWGEFDTAEQKESSSVKNEYTISEESKSPEKFLETEETEVLPLRERIINHLASTSVTLKSQQRYEPDPTFEERKVQAAKLLEKPGQFLYRFGKLLLREHFQYFLKYEGDPEVDYYVAESLKHLNKHTAKVTVQNRRYAAMQELRRSTDYFSEKEMERRNPLLYDQLVAQHQTDDERAEQVDEIDLDPQRFSSFLLKHFDNCSERNLKKQQEEEEDDMLEEEETDSEEDEEQLEETREHIDSRQKELLKEEFYSLSYQSFLRGRDTDFDYSKVDASDDYDLLEIRARDEEERYFDEDEDEDTGTSNMCLDRVDIASVSSPDPLYKSKGDFPDTEDTLVMNISSQNCNFVSHKGDNHMDIDDT